MGLTLLLIDGFDHYDTTNATLEWLVVAQGSITASGRNGNGWTQSSGGQVSYRYFGARSIVQIGIAFKSSLLVAARKVIALYDEATLHIDVRYTSDGLLYVTRNGTLLATSGVKTIQANVWYYIEIKAQIADSPNGAVAVYVNGEEFINASSLDTRNGANAQVTRFGVVADNNVHYYDDLYVGYLSAFSDDAIFGDVKVETLHPSADGYGTPQWTPSVEGDNYSCVDEVTPNQTDYVESDTPDNIDLYDIDNLEAESGTVYGLQIELYAMKTDAAARAIRRVLRTSDTNYIGASDISLSTSWAYYRELIQTDPSGGDWTISKINGLQIGVKDQS